MSILNAVPTGDSTQVKEAHSLNPEPYIELYELSLPAVSEGFKIFLSPRQEIQWQGKTWEQFACELTGMNTNSGGELVRPKFQVMNPASIFSLYVAQGKLDNATLRKYRVLAQHITDNLDISLQYYWKVGKVLNLNRNAITLELRAFYDGQKFQLPIRKYFPPDFTHVSLG